jgi:hypothetical protein
MKKSREALPFSTLKYLWHQALSVSFASEAIDSKLTREEKKEKKIRRP